jgi:hypothetical protein
LDPFLQHQLPWDFVQLHSMPSEFVEKLQDFIEELPQQNHGPPRHSMPSNDAADRGIAASDAAAEQRDVRDSITTERSSRRKKF